MCALWNGIEAQKWWAGKRKRGKIVTVKRGWKEKEAHSVIRGESIEQSKKQIEKKRCNPFGRAVCILPGFGVGTPWKGASGIFAVELQECTCTCVRVPSLYMPVRVLERARTG